MIGNKTSYYEFETANSSIPSNLYLFLRAALCIAPFVDTGIDNMNYLKNTYNGLEGYEEEAKEYLARYIKVLNSLAGEILFYVAIEETAALSTSYSIGFSAIENYPIMNAESVSVDSGESYTF